MISIKKIIKTFLISFGLFKYYLIVGYHLKYKTSLLFSRKFSIQPLNKEDIKLLIAIDYDFYRSNNKYFDYLSNEQLLDHYTKYGYHQGHISHPKAIRENFSFIEKSLNCLEIGPFCYPILKGNNVKYFDVLSKSDLTKRAKLLSDSIDNPASFSEEDLNNIPDIDFVSENGDLNIVKDKFDIVFSAHNLEHQPDLINHLNQVSNLLSDNGKYKIIVPNSAFCFDVNLPTSKISEIIEASRNSPKTHSIAKVIEHRAFISHNDTVIHWENSLNNKIIKYNILDTELISSAIIEFDKSKGNYIDVHAWQFQPHTLSDILRVLIKLKLIKFKDYICFGPVIDRNEFCLELIK